MDDEQRLIELETKLVYQEDTLRVLNDIVTRQQQQIDQLESTCRQLIERMTQGLCGNHLRQAAPQLGRAHRLRRPLRH